MVFSDSRRVRLGAVRLGATGILRWRDGDPGRQRSTGGERMPARTGVEIPTQGPGGAARGKTGGRPGEE